MHEYLAQSGIDTPSPTPLWNESVEDELLDPRLLYDKYPRLADAVHQMTAGAAMALTAAVAEWIAFRFRHEANLTEVRHAVESGFAAAIDPLYSMFNDEALAELPDSQEASQDDTVTAVLEFAGYLISTAHYHFTNPDEGSVFDVTIACCVMAGHVLPPGSVFDGWLQGLLRRLSQRFPADGAGDEGLGEAVAPQCFDDGPAPDAAGYDRWIAEFLTSLDPARNPYLRPAKAMLERGYVGQPYRWPRGVRGS